MATTANGWPYVVPTDKPLEYPALSQALANLLDARDTTLKIVRAGVLTADVGGLLTITGQSFKPGTTIQPLVVPYGSAVAPYIAIGGDHTGLTIGLKQLNGAAAAGAQASVWLLGTRP